MLEIVEKGLNYTDTTENALAIQESIYAQMLKELDAAGAYLCSAESLGPKAERLAVTVKGKKFPAHMPTSQGAMGPSPARSTRGWASTRAYPTPGISTSRRPR